MAIWYWGAYERPLIGSPLCRVAWVSFLQSGRELDWCSASQNSVWFGTTRNSVWFGTTQNSVWFGTTRNSVWFQISLKSVITIRICLALKRFPKEFAREGTHHRGGNSVDEVHGVNRKRGDDMSSCPLCSPCVYIYIKYIHIYTYTSICLYIYGWYIYFCIQLYI